MGVILLVAIDDLLPLLLGEGRGEGDLANSHSVGAPLAVG
jgi:hypothetical protein